ncbi:MAG TPA: DNA mismatch endonuclease Vsr [Paludibacter sp.]|nr:DNA mismatch endonuclease Vsr [Paludibacter sp.]
MDIFSKTKRSELMSKIKGKETKPEILVRKYLFAKGFRYRKNVKKLAGTPDIVLAKYKTVIFIHGCFWHSHQDCKDGHLPSSNEAYWKEKLDKNVERDHKNISILSAAGWRVIVIWECELKTILLRNSRLEKLIIEITNPTN